MQGDTGMSLTDAPFFFSHNLLNMSAGILSFSFFFSPIFQAVRKSVSQFSFSASPSILVKDKASNSQA